MKMVSLLLLGGIVTAMSGCANGTSTKAGAISVTYPSGVTSGQLPVLSTATVAMMPVNDKANLGVDWTLTCGGNAQIGYTTTGCGTLVPSHTADGSAATYTAPGVIPANVTATLTARVTSDPSQQSSVTITIVNPPISVTLSKVSASLRESVGRRVVEAARRTRAGPSSQPRR